MLDGKDLGKIEGTDKNLDLSDKGNLSIETALDASGVTYNILKSPTVFYNLETGESYVTEGNEPFSGILDRNQEGELVVKDNDGNTIESNIVTLTDEQMKDFGFNEETGEFDNLPESGTYNTDIDADSFTFDPSTGELS